MTMNVSLRTLPNSSFTTFLPNDALENFLTQVRNNEKEWGQIKVVAEYEPNKCQTNRQG
jgi:hypothetical protein